MKCLVVGGGSIGKRHLNNLRRLGLESLALVETDGLCRNAIASELHVEGFSDLATGLDWSPDFVVIASPTHFHAEQTLRVVEDCRPVFVEKPLSHSPDRLQKIAERVERSKLISMVACNMRFHPGPAQVYKLLQQREIGRILFARLQVGSYLPDWRPSQDYRTNYAAREETGGGCILDCIHEIDLARWYLGEIEKVFCASGHLSSLEIETDDVASLICRHESGALSEIHMDYVQRTYERDCQIVGEQGSIFWEYGNNQVRWFESVSGQWTTFSQPNDWELNEMYVDEMKHFLECVRTGCETVLPIREALAVMQIAFAAKTSAREGRFVAAGRATLV